MKQFFKTISLALAIVLMGSLQNKASAQYPDDEVSYQTFYDELSPYGQWIDYPEYGYVWAPNLGPDFRPYSSNGHWVYTDDYEWMWVSDYDWGWAPFHYGRWLNDPYYGWVWVPGYEWAPAWVVWRGGGDYYGWAPLRPGITISVGFSLGSYYAPDDYWCFAPSRYITSPRIYDYCIDRRQNINIIHNTIIINNYTRNRNVFVTGPRRLDAERYCGRISPIRFRDSYRPGRTQFRNNSVSVYRPNIQRDDNRRFSPRSFDRYDRRSQNIDTRTSRNDNRVDRNNNRIDRIDNNRERIDNNRVNGNDNTVRRDRRDNDNNRFRQPPIINRDNRNDNRVNEGRVNEGRVNEGRVNEGRVNEGRVNRDNNRQVERNDQIRMRRQMERSVGPSPRNNDNRINEQRSNRDENRSFRNDNRSIRQPAQPAERQQQPARTFERRENNRPNQESNNNGRGNGRKRF